VVHPELAGDLADRAATIQGELRGCFDAPSRVLLLGYCQVWRCPASGGHCSVRRTAGTAASVGWGDLRTRILDAAVEGAGEPGYDGTTIALVKVVWAARQLDLLALRHKDDLIAAVIERSLRGPASPGHLGFARRQGFDPEAAD
jgi:hypothetical protein